jgi:hypothetical protein
MSNGAGSVIDSSRISERIGRRSLAIPSTGLTHVEHARYRAHRVPVADRRADAMSVTEHTLKLLWGDAANRCAICKRLLTEDSSTIRRTVIGEAAHIVARSPRGPRGEGSRPDDIDGYDNLILLCPDDHKVIDDRPAEYSIAWLQARKRAHCDWVKACLSTQHGAAINRSVGNDQLLLRNYGPSAWLCPPNANGPEILLRATAALPAPMPRRIEQPSETSSLLLAEGREDLILDALDNAVLTRELRSLQSSWNWVNDLGWHVQGGSPGPEVTIASFDLEWAAPRIRQPLALRCAVLTGWTDAPEWRKALLVALDLSISVLELDRDRLPGEIRHFSTPAPVPAALKPEELGALVSLLVSEVGPLGTELLGPLAGLEPETTGQVATWLQHDGIALDRFVDLTGWTRLPNPSASARAEAAESWPFTEDGQQRGERRLASGLLASALRNNDYRRFQPRLDQMFNLA